MKDVVLALRWVRDNIVAFKGNPDKVVLAGQSFGAAMVEAVILSSMATGLYHGAILQSGSALAPWAFNYDAEERAQGLRITTNIDVVAGDLTKWLLRSNIDDLVDKANKLDVPYFPFGMCIESPLKKEERLLSAAPFDLLLNKKGTSVPLVIGYNDNEAYVFISMLREARVFRRMSGDLSFLLPEELRFFNKRERRQIARQIKDMYFKRNSTMAAVLAYHR